MMGRAKLLTNRLILLAMFTLLLAGLTTIGVTKPAHALLVTQSGDVSVTATVIPTAPTEAAIIDQPQSNTHVTTTPLVVIGRCGADLLVRIYDNGQLAGSVTCASDSTFTANITLVPGKNVLSILNYNGADQAGPASPDITVYVDLTPAKATSLTADEAIIDNAVGPVDGTPLSIGFNPENDSQRLFEGTIVEPLVKALEIPAPVVAPSTNQVVNAAVGSTFVLAIVLLGALLLL
jgi:hypothetical protein